jgi:uncharacterized protein YfaT (DUF1175 family)
MSVFLPVGYEENLIPRYLFSGGQGSARVTISINNIFGRTLAYYPWTIRADIIKGEGLIRILGSTESRSGEGQLEFAIQALGKPGCVEVEVDNGLFSEVLNLTLLVDEQDSDRDGFPNEVELSSAKDRLRFRNWFCAIATAQFYKIDRRWQPIHQDCAGLLRFAYKEALRVHDKEWLKKTAYLHRSVPGDVQKYNYPLVPVIQDRVFRIQPGPYRENEVDQAFSQTASARLLWEENTFFVSRDIRHARSGDLIFFRDPERFDSPMHSMILLDDGCTGKSERLVYHTGNAEEDHGEVRLVRVIDLNNHRDSRWHLKRENKNFLGFYRWKILEGGRP